MQSVCYSQKPKSADRFGLMCLLEQLTITVCKALSATTTDAVTKMTMTVQGGHEQIVRGC